MTPATTGFRVEVGQMRKISVMQVEGRLTLVGRLLSSSVSCPFRSTLRHRLLATVTRLRLHVALHRGGFGMRIVKCAPLTKSAQFSLMVWTRAATEVWGRDTSAYCQNPVAFSDLQSTCRSVSRCRNPYRFTGILQLLDLGLNRSEFSR